MKQIIIHSLLIISVLVGQRATAMTATPEINLLEALTAIKQLQIDDAIDQLQQLVREKPDFRLAQLVYADLLSAKAQGLKQMGDRYTQHPEFAGLQAEATARWKAKRSDLTNLALPSSLLNLDESYRYAVTVDLLQSRLYLFENRQGIPSRVADFYISMGKNGPSKQYEGDNRTPLGVYFIENFLSPDSLPDKYGLGAYPLNYPNAWDQRLGRTGYGIWLHGTPTDTYSRPPRDSEGCVVLSNSDLQQVGSYLQLRRTPVVISDNIQWLDQQQWQRDKRYFMALFEQWRQDWQSRNIDSYLSHYSASFDNGKQNYQRWRQHKTRVTQYKKNIQVDVDDLSVLRHPKDDIVVITFRQHYQSDNFSSVSYKRQYWRLEDDGRWRIIFEGRIRQPV